MPNQRDVESVVDPCLQNGSSEILITEWHNYYEILVTIKVKNITVNRQLFLVIYLVFFKQVSPNL